MIQQTSITIFGCRIWLEHDNKRTLRSATLKFQNYMNKQFDFMSSHDKVQSERDKEDANARTNKDGG